MDKFITKSKYFSSDFNTAIFSDPIRIYFSQEYESHALEIYFQLQKRKNQWEKFLREKGSSNYCYIMLYSDPKMFEKCFRGESTYAPADFGDDYLIGINGPMDSDGFGRFLENIDQEIGYISATG